MRTNFSAGGLRNGHSERCLPTPEPDKERIEPLGFFTSWRTARNPNAVLYLLQPIMIFIENLLSARDVAKFPSTAFSRHGQQPIEIIAGDSRLSRHRRHGFELLQLLHGLSRTSLDMPAASIFSSAQQNIKAIQKELAPAKRANLDELKKKIEAAGMSKDVRDKAMQELKKARSHAADVG